MEFSDREPHNKIELQLYLKAKTAGWQVARRGWPDFICWKDNQAVCVEVKNSKDDKLSEAQATVMELLANLGVKCYRWDPDNGFARIRAARNSSAHIKAAGSTETLRRPSSPGNREQHQESRPVTG